jgi:hypothetical protein
MALCFLPGTSPLFYHLNFNPSNNVAPKKLFGSENRAKKTNCTEKNNYREVENVLPNFSKLLRTLTLRWPVKVN